VPNPLTPEQIEELATFDTCAISDAIESFGVRLRNEGFVTSGVRCLSKSLPPMVGYAVTCKIRSADPPVVGQRYDERTDWWKDVTATPAPRVLVMQDMDRPPGTGAFFGLVHANALMALGCVGAVTNGAARELPGIVSSGFQIFAGRVAVSRAYIHIIEYGGDVEIRGLTVRPGDLLHGDRHGVVTIPRQLIAELPKAALAIVALKRRVIALARKPGVNQEELIQGLKELTDFTPDSLRDGAKK
jgi:regulator of RNase E activity RraA